MPATTGHLGMCGGFCPGVNDQCAPIIGAVPCACVPPPSTPTATESPTPSPTGTPTATDTSTATGTPSPIATAIAPLNHFQCYEVHSGPFHGQSVSLDDQFGPSTVRIRHPKRICNPADKNQENGSVPPGPDHLVGYPITQDSAFKTIRDVLVTDQFGTLTVDVIRPEYLLVPSAKSEMAPPPPFTPSIEHFKCYRVKGTHFRRANVRIDDQFGTIVVDIKRPRRLCVPANKNTEGLKNGVDHLMCYEVRLETGGAFKPAGHLFINNQFGPDDFRGFRARELCVPALKTLTHSTPVPTATPTPVPSPGPCGLQADDPAPVCAGTCQGEGQHCVFEPVRGGPGGPGVCACAPTNQLCNFVTVGQCGGFCPHPTDQCLLFVDGNTSCECAEPIP